MNTHGTLQHTVFPGLFGNRATVLLGVKPLAQRWSRFCPANENPFTPRVRKDGYLLPINTTPTQHPRSWNQSRRLIMNECPIHGVNTKVNYQIINAESLEFGIASFKKIIIIIIKKEKALCVSRNH